MKKSLSIQEIMDFARKYFREVARSGNAVPSDAVLDKAMEIIVETEQNDSSFTGKSYRTRCASAVYIALMLDKTKGNYVTQTRLADAFNCSEVSIRNVYKDMLKSYSKRHVLEPPRQVFGWARKEIFKL